MTAKNKETDNAASSRPYHGFSLKSVCWGYRDIFARTIEGLFRDGAIGSAKPEVTDAFFDMLKTADQSCFDYVLKKFLGAINPRTRWLLDLPGIFVDVVDLGRELAESKLHYGITFFETLGEGGFGETPEQVRNLLTHVRQLREIDEELAIAFLQGYGNLVDRLNARELGIYIDAGLDIFSRNRKSGIAFMAGTLKSSETYVRSISRECRLDDVKSSLESLVGALVGYPVEVADLSGLDSDELIERGSSSVCMYQWMFLPARVRYFERHERNRKWYILCALLGAALLEGDSFCRVHGVEAFKTCEDIVGTDALKLNLFQIMEYVRTIRRLKHMWPGAARLVDFGLAAEFEQRSLKTDPDRLFRDAVAAQRPQSQAVKLLLTHADRSVNCFDTARRLEQPWVNEVRDSYPELACTQLRPFSCLPDFLYPGSVDTAPADSMVADLKDAARANAAEEETGEERSGEKGVAIPRTATGDQEDGEEDEEGKTGIPAGFLYDEWSQEENDYYRDFCLVHEQRAEGDENVKIPADVSEEARRVSRVFEQFKPDLAQREKYLQEGDSINEDLLLKFLVARQHEPSPQVDFYEKPVINQRDLGVLILLDVSGSTGETVEEAVRIIDIEKHAAVILGQGLAALGDRFCIAGFSSNGRENCHYNVYKDFQDDWERESIGRVLSASPANSTRMGPALRHGGFRLSLEGCRQRLIILVTDGRPMDSGYDPNTRYAQHDVRMACEENAREHIHTFAISTEENSVADMEIMFPRRRYAILSDIRQLPKVLPRLYSKLTIT